MSGNWAFRWPIWHDSPSAAGVVKGIAVTGSDPYLVRGTDVAILFETDEEAKGKLLEYLRGRLDATCRAASAGIAPTEGTKDGSGFLFATTPSRRSAPTSRRCSIVRSS